MLHNTGPFGPNETPVNMAAPVNMTPSGHMNIVSNINNLAKIGHGNPPTPSGAYGLSDYAVFHQQHYNMTSQMAQFSNQQYQHLGFQHSYSNHNPGSVNEASYQNGLLPMNLNLHGDHSNDMLNYSYEKRMSEQVRPEIIKEQNLRKIPLNIPQIPNKSLAKQPLFNNDYVHNDSFHNPNDNLDLSMKTHDRLPLTNSRRKKIENTVKLIENILINSANIPKDPLSPPVYDMSSGRNYNRSPEPDTVTNMSMDSMRMSPNATRTSIETPKMMTSTIRMAPDVTKMTTSLTRMPTETKISTSTDIISVDTLPVTTSAPRMLTETTRLSTSATRTSLSPSMSPDSRRMSIDDTDNDNVDPLSLTMEDSIRETVQERESIIKSPIHTSIERRVTIDSAEDEQESQSSDNEDVKPIGITVGIAPENNSPTSSEKHVEIKIEKASWTDTDYVQPFFRDCNAFPREDTLDYRIIEGETSINEAKTAVKTNIKTEDCYECPSCCILFKNPKRFLIHTKWHTFGLTNEKRIELLREREEKRNQRKEAKIVERMNSKDVTNKKEKVVGKTWPCKDCDKVFSAKGSLKNHRQRTHPTRIRECRICHKSLVGWIALRNHMATHAGESGVGFQCHECPKRFKYAHSLAKHSDTHLEKTHGCTECPKKFGSQALLKMHMKTHERHIRGATFRCTYCAKGFFESYSLQVHERTHRNERPYTCDICNTSFGTNSSLKRHLKVSHSTSKPWECSVCHRSFSTEPIRDRHEQRLHGKPEDFKFPCKQCACKYMNLKDLQKHVYKAHPKTKRKKKVKVEEEPAEESE